MTAPAAQPAPDAPAVLLVSVQADLDVIGLKYIHASLRAAGYRSHLLFLPRGGGVAARAAVARFAQDVRPLYVGVSLMTPEFTAARAVTRALRAAATGAPILWGGIHPMVAPEECLVEADLVCLGEGEATAVAVADALRAGADPRSLPNLSWRDGPAVRRNELLPPLSDLDTLPVIAHLPPAAFIVEGDRVVPLVRRHLKRHGRYGGAVYSVMSSRGCPFRCTYCANDHLARLYGSRRVRRRSLEAVLGELEQAVRDHPAIRFVNFHDDSFLSARQDELEAFCALYRARVRRPFLAKGIPTVVTDPQALALLRDAGLAWLNLGLQSGSDRVCRDVYRRPSYRSDFLRAAAAVKAAGVAAWYDVILDNPFETATDRLRTIDALSRAPRPYYPKFFSLALYPGTALYERARREGTAFDDPHTKDYAEYRRDPLNELTRLSAFLPRPWTVRLVGLWRRAPAGRRFRWERRAASLATSLFLEPLTYWRVARLSQHGSAWRTLRSLPVYAGDGLRRYLHPLRAAWRARERAPERAGTDGAGRSTGRGQPPVHPAGEERP